MSRLTDQVGQQVRGFVTPRGLQHQNAGVLQRGQSPEVRSRGDQNRTPGSSGNRDLTWVASKASSSASSTERSASRTRNRAARVPSPSGCPPGSSLAETSISARTFAGSRALSSEVRGRTNQCPSGKAVRAMCATWTAKAAFPVPGPPLTTTIGKRHIAVDTRGLLLNAIVTPADLPDRAVARDMLTRLRLLNAQLTLVWADSACGGELVEWARTPVSPSPQDRVTAPEPGRVRRAAPALDHRAHVVVDHEGAQELPGLRTTGRAQRGIPERDGRDLDDQAPDPPTRAHIRHGAHPDGDDR